MYLDRILYPVTALGPGERVAIWVAGCHRRCRGCANPELWERHPEQRIEPLKLAGYVNRIRRRAAGSFRREIGGITLTGGEPFEQAGELAVFLDHLDWKPEILVFSGYRLEELREKREHLLLLDRIDVLIDGPYREDENDGQAGLRGSLNQNILFFNQKVKETYDRYLGEGRKIQNFVYDYKTISVGIHHPPG